MTQMIKDQYVFSAKSILKNSIIEVIFSVNQLQRLTIVLMMNSKLNLAKYRNLEEKKALPEKKSYKSKYVQKLLDSDESSSENDDSFQYEIDDKVPDLIKKVDQYKENVFDTKNRPIPASFITYKSFKIAGSDLIEEPKNQYGTINLEQSSLIQQNQEVLNKELEKMQKKHQQEKNTYNAKIEQLTNQNDNLMKELRLLHQQLEKKDHQLSTLKHDYTKIEESLKKYQQKVKTLEYSSEYNSAKKFESKFGSQAQRKLIGRKDSKEDEIYQQVTKYLGKCVQSLRNKLIDKKMTPIIEEILEDFMAQILHINPISVSRSKSRLKESVHQNNTSFISQHKGSFRSGLSPHKTPQKLPTNQQSKSPQLLELQKSLHKLRQMEKSFVSGKPNYESLERSSFISAVSGDRSYDRSRSRRKKIFQ